MATKMSMTMGPAPAARRAMVAPMLLVAAALAGIGCVRQESPAPPADTQPDRPANGDSGSRPGATNRLSPGDSSMGDAPPATATRTIPAGTVVAARLDTTLDSGSAAIGDTVRATVTADVRDTTGEVGLPSGTVLTGRVTDVQPARKVHKMSSLAFHFDTAVLPDGATAGISASEGADGKGWTKKQGAIIGGSAAGGAVLGQVIGHDTQSTVTGAIVGGAIATGVIMSHKGEDIVISSGSNMELTLDSDVVVKRASDS